MEKNKLYSDLVLRYIQPDKWWERAQWELVNDYVSSDGISVPKGFITDGVSVPWPLIVFMSPTGLLFPAAIVHDYMLISTNYDWKLANEQFAKELQYINTSRFRKICALTAVKCWGKIKPILTRIKRTTKNG